MIICCTVNGGSRWYYWFNMVVPLGSEGSVIPVLKGFMVSPVISICRLPLSKYLSFTSLGNTEWFYSQCSCSFYNDSCTGLFVRVFLNWLGDILNSRNQIWWNIDWWGLCSWTCSRIYVARYWGRSWCGEWFLGDVFKIFQVWMKVWSVDYWCWVRCKL